MPGQTNQQHNNAEAEEFRKLGYESVITKNFGWVELREEINLKMWDTFFLLMGALALQTGFSTQPFVTFVGYIFPIILWRFSRKWTRYTNKAQQETLVAEDLETEAQLQGVELRKMA